MVRVCLTILLVLCGTGGVIGKDYTKPPNDPAEADRLRIWVPVKRQACQTQINILDAKGDTVRHFIQDQYSPGYYNFYWDKKNDANEFVPAGTYQYLVSACGIQRVGNVTAAYVPGELDCRVAPAKSYNSLDLIFHVLKDTTLISLEVYNRRDELVAIPFKDSLFTKGDFDYTWKPDSTVQSGTYKFLLTVEDFSHVIYRRYVKK